MLPKPLTAPCPSDALAQLGQEQSMDSVSRFMIWATISFGAVLVALVIPLFPPTPADAQTQQQIDWCENNGYVYTPDLQINGCTAAIQSGRWSGKDLALVFNNRGNAYSDKNDYDRAIADFNQAIRLDPKYAFPHDGRGKAYYAKNDLNHAFADFDEAVHR
jgi:tetratricopeptide (TPR) repeat protein